jgi:integrase
MKTGRNLLDAIAAVFSFALELGLIESNPVDGFRRTLSRKSRTKRGRAENDPGRDIRPIEHPAEIAKLVEAARGEGLETHVLMMLLLDAGLRVGEALGLRWRAVTWGDDDQDRRRALLIDTSRPRGGEAEAPKSGRARKVQLSRRLRGALFALYRQRERPAGDAFVLRRPVATFRNVVWPRILRAADIGHRRPKDLRDTFASQLLSAGRAARLRLDPARPRGLRSDCAPLREVGRRRRVQRSTRARAGRSSSRPTRAPHRVPSESQDLG